MASCPTCRQAFEILPEDLEMLKKLSPSWNGKTEELPAPKQCPACRLQRRMCERNTRNLYYRKCDLTGKQIISQYNKDCTFPVYNLEDWGSDKWDALTYGRDFDFSKPFFAQFKELADTVPHMALFNTPGTNENSDFNNCTAYLKNCYLICESDFNEDCYYSNLLKKCKDTVDCSVCYEDELCYECIDCIGCNRLFYSQDCTQCSDSYFLRNCSSCRDCIGCVNQRQKQYMIFNTQYSKAEYEKMKKASQLDAASGLDKIREACEKFFITQPHKAMHGESNENSSGDFINNCKNVYRSFDMKDCEDCRHCERLSLNCKTCMDFNSWGDKAELLYQCVSCGDNAYNSRFCSNCIVVTNADYSYECFHCSDIFGCIGLRQKKYCILNKQYTKEEYEALVPKIIAHMRRSGEWGEFFPFDLCPYAYNEAFVLDQFPMTKADVEKRGWRWYEPEDKSESYMGAAEVLPDSINDTDESVCEKILQCAAMKKPYKIIPQEFRFYKKMGIPLPRTCPDARHMERQKKRNPYVLWDRKCAKCSKDLETTYAPERPEPIFCEACYLATVY